MTTLEFTFWAALGLLGYVYAGYPVLVWMLSRVRPRPIRSAPATPTITVVIAAHNEERCIAAKIENCLGLDYPSDRLNVIVVSDGSVDRTPALVAECESRLPDRVRLIALSRRQGKASALNIGVAHASGELVLFADARQRLDGNVARAMALNFADPEVGAVSGELILTTDGQENGVGLYWWYEKALRQAESRWGSSMGYTGAVAAIRRSLFEPLPEDTLLDDLVTPLRLISKHYRVVFEPAARAFDTVSAEPGHEFARKVRTLAGVLQTCLNVRGLVGGLPARVWWQLFSHKLLRLLVPYVLVVVLVTNALVPGPVYRAVLLGQVLFYVLGLAGLIFHRRLGRSRVLALPATFLLLNSAAAVSAFRYLVGSRLDLWRTAVPEPPQGASAAGAAYAGLSGVNRRKHEDIR